MNSIKIMSEGGYIVINEYVAKRYGIIFASFLGAICRKFEALKMSEKYKNKPNFEFYYTENNSYKDIGISYYLRNKAIKLGIELELWKCEMKYSPNVTGINKLTHFYVNAKKINELVKKLIEEDKVNQNADEQFIEEAQKEELEDLQIEKNNEIEILKSNVFDFIEKMTEQNGVKNKESYKLTILRKFHQNDKKTLKNLKYFIANKKQSENIISSEDYSKYKYRGFISEKKNYYIQNIEKTNDGILVNANSTFDNISPLEMKVPKNKIEFFITQLIPFQKE